jgi:hypothetical protein
MKYAIRFTLFVLSISFLLVFAAQSPAHAQTVCDTKSSGKPSGTAMLSLTVPHIDNATWTSTMNISVPLSWSLADNLFQDVSSDGFQEAYYCLFPYFPPPNSVAVSVSRDQGYAKLRISDHGSVKNWYIYITGPWSVRASQQDLSIAFEPSLDFSDINIDWTSIAATVQGFRITDPEPLPATDSSSTKLVWNPAPSRGDNLVTFTLIPERLLRVALTAQTGGLGQDIPLQLEELAFPVALIAIFSRRRRDEKSIVGRIWAVTRRLCYTVAALSAIQVAIDIFSQATPRTYRIYRIQDIAQLIVIYAIGLAVLRPHLRKASRPLIAAVISLISLCFIGSVLVDVIFYISIFNGSIFLADFGLYGLLLLRAIQLCATFLSWMIIINGLLGTFWQTSDTARRPRSFILPAAILALLNTFTVRSGFFPTSIFPTVFLPNIAGFIIVFGALLIVARDQRPVPLLLESSDRKIIALIVGYGMLLTGPTWYLGFHVGLVSIISLFATLVVLTVSSRHSLIQPPEKDKHPSPQLADDLDPPRVRPAGEVLKGKTQEELRTLQRKLFDAEDQLKKVTRDLNVLQATPLVTSEQLARREWLEREEQRLRSWPTNENHENAGSSAWLNSVLLNSRGEEFPEPAGPVDMAMALGPTCDPAGNLSRAFRPALMLILLPACYFAWRQNLANQYSPRNLLYYVGLIENLSEELAFWLLAPLVLAVAWSSLAGRRGSERGLQAWLFVSLPMAVHVFFNQVFNQSATLISVLQCAILLVILLVLGVWIDLSTLRRYRRNVTSFKLFQGYVRLNRVVAAVTLLIPLATAGLTIWNQINSGVLHQKVSPAQGAVSTQSPASSPSPTPSAQNHPHPATTATPHHTQRPR